MVIFLKVKVCRGLDGIRFDVHLDRITLLLDEGEGDLVLEKRNHC